MKNFGGATLSLLAATLSVAAAAPTIQLVFSRSDDACTAFGEPGLLKLKDANGHMNGTVLAEGTFSATGNEQGNTNLITQFEQCDFDGYNYQQGSSRNSGGSMGAPIEYFGRVTRGSDCLTASTTDIGADGNAFRYNPCSTEDDEIRLKQFFTYQISATESIDIGFVGAKNDTQNPYKGPYGWTAGPKFSPAWPRVIQASDQKHDYELELVSSSD
ncbi:uncharacterized protein FA14DRAFT_161284 [Meira miltonrushii]|uniref:Uncharacterized protein n=1 Tax=Meira miltonrushii TaxID=1280837 RepID=A0A316V7C9_9BASI|nr:uncharacterized protein FA14DRAFT_161284 [Meira miltonrushii]PWN33426.1 hypothetical protein FA14DRAFT_161284 [Meira miltonrushii]